MYFINKIIRHFPSREMYGHNDGHDDPQTPQMAGVNAIVDAVLKFTSVHFIAVLSSLSLQLMCGTGCSTCKVENNGQWQRTYVGNIPVYSYAC